MGMKNLALFLVLMPCAVSLQAQQAWDKLSGDSAVARAQTAAARDAAQWKALWAKHKGDAKAVAPAVDFSREMVVAVFLGQKPTAGYKVELKTMPDPLDPSRLVVFYQEVAPSKESFQLSAVTRPFAMRKVAKASEVVFEADGKCRTPEKTGFKPGISPEGRLRIQDAVASFSTFQFPR